MAKIRNIGPTSRRWLAELEIYSTQDLRQHGAVIVYEMIRARHPQVTLNLLWALEGAILDVDWRSLSSQHKEALMSQVRDSKH